MWVAGWAGQWGARLSALQHARPRAADESEVWHGTPLACQQNSILNPFTSLEARGAAYRRFYSPIMVYGTHKEV